MQENPLRSLADFGQSPWLDYIRRDLIASGKLRRLVEEDGLKGLTSNPTIFEQAIGGNDEYADVLQRSKARDALACFEDIAVRDLQDAADVLASVYRATGGADGFVCLEVRPSLAYDTDATIVEARRLWKKVDRPNLMIKVPATLEGLPAIETLIAEGINVNITLLFGRETYERVADAYLRGLERRAAAGQAIGFIASVASFFVSRIDTAVDKLLEARAGATSDEAEQERLRSLTGKTAIANAKLAYQRYLRIFAGKRWEKLAVRGARPQRLLWASTSTKNPRYRDVMYVEELIGRDTVNTMPPATLDAFRDHGRVRASLTENVDGARADLARLAATGIMLDDVTAQLVIDGVKSFDEAFDKLLGTVRSRLSETHAASAG